MDAQNEVNHEESEQNEVDGRRMELMLIPHVQSTEHSC